LPSTLEKNGIIGVREAYSNEQGFQNQQSIVIETYCDDNSIRGPTAGALGLGFTVFLVLKPM